MRWTYQNRFYHPIRHGVLISIAWILLACGGSDTAEVQDSTPQQASHDMGDVWAMVYPTSIAGNAADHTFLQGLDQEGRLTNWMCFGAQTDGAELAGTRTDAVADLTVVAFMAAESPCKWPLTYYLRTGVCHQCANRGLHYTGKTVADSLGYAFFAGIFGTYGDETEGFYSMERCLAAAPPWQGPDLRSSPSGGFDDQAEEIALFSQYLENHKAGGSNGRSKAAAQGEYLDALFHQLIMRRLGADFPQDTIAALQAERHAALDEKKALDAWAAAADLEPLELVEHYDWLFNDLAERYKTLLTPDEYERLFDLPYEAPIDLQRFLPPQ